MSLPFFGRSAIAAVLAAALTAGCSGAPQQPATPTPQALPAPAPVQLHPAMLAMMEVPQLALHHREHLGLTTDQVQRLEAAQQRLQHRHHALMEQMQAAHTELAAAADEQLDEPRARAAFLRMGELHADMGVAVLQARQETRAVLAEQQRERFSELIRQDAERMMQHMMQHDSGAMHPGHMMMTPMMPHGAPGAGQPQQPHDH